MPIEKERDETQSYDGSPHTNRKIQQPIGSTKTPL